MRVIISAGGTGGHIYPALAIINKIKEEEPDSKFVYIGTHNRMEKDIIPKYDIPFKSIEVYGLNRKSLFKNFKTLSCFVKTTREMKKFIKEFNPDVVIGVGGYVTGPVLYAASKVGVNTFIHEQNSVPGKANVFLSRHVDKIGVSFKESRHEFPFYKTVFTGNPCSEAAINKKLVPKVKYGLSKDKKSVLIVMGSLGSSRVNDILMKAIKLFEDKDYDVLFITGTNSYDEIIKAKVPANVKIFPYIENLSGLMKDIDLVVSRAGASTLSEISALGLPSILIPSPYVPNNHQYKNAMAMVKKGCANIIEEKNLSGKKLVDEIDALISSKEKIDAMRDALALETVEDSSSRIYNVLKEMVYDE